MRVEAPVQFTNELGAERCAGLRRGPTLHLQVRERKLLPIALLGRAKGSRPNCQQKLEVRLPDS